MRWHAKRNIRKYRRVPLSTNSGYVGEQLTTQKSGHHGSPFTFPAAIHRGPKSPFLTQHFPSHRSEVPQLSPIHSFIHNVLCARASRNEHDGARGDGARGDAAFPSATFEMRNSTFDIHIFGAP